MDGQNAESLLCYVGRFSTRSVCMVPTAKTILLWTTHAAMLLDGETLHKFVQVGIAPLPKDITLASVRSKFRVKERKKNVGILY